MLGNGTKEVAVSEVS
jgi:hypothetical protein